MSFLKNLFSSKNKVRFETAKQIPNDIVEKVSSLILSNEPFQKIRDITGENQVELNILQKSFDKAIEQFLDDNLLSEEEEGRITLFMEYFNLTQQDLDKNGSYMKIAQSKIMREILNGETPTAVYINSGTLPFNLTKNEKIIWLFNNVKYSEDTVQKSYVGGSRGVSVRVAKGVYLRGGSYKGKIVETNYLKYVGIGIMLITNKNVYYSSNQKTFKIPHTKIIGVTPFSDGIQLFKDGVNAKAQYFTQIDGLFAYNLISNMNLLE